MAKIKLGVLGSGKGTNFVAIAQSCAEAIMPAEIAVTLADVPDAGILKQAASLGVPGRYIDPGKFRTKLDDTAEAAYIAALIEAQVDLVVLAGFMRILKGPFLAAFPGRVINIHPSLLPSFPGIASWKQALEHGVKVTGCTVHWVDQGIDTGRIVAQQSVPILDGDTSETLHERIQQAERVLYPQAIAELIRKGVVKSAV